MSKQDTLDSIRKNADVYEYIGGPRSTRGACPYGYVREGEAWLPIAHLWPEDTRINILCRSLNFDFLLAGSMRCN